MKMGNTAVKPSVKGLLIGFCVCMFQLVSIERSYAQENEYQVQSTEWMAKFDEQLMRSTSSLDDHYRTLHGSAPTKLPEPTLEKAKAIAIRVSELMDVLWANEDLRLEVPQEIDEAEAPRLMRAIALRIDDIRIVLHKDANHVPVPLK